jgi:hypothetical protein
MSRARALWIPPLLAALLLAWPPAAHAAGGNYSFDGGTAAQRGEVRAALAASSFPWSTFRTRITVHIAPGARSEATPGHVWLDDALLDSGRFSWGIVQHEYAHQVDFFLLDDAKRALLLGLLGGRDWWGAVPGLAHEQYGCERFASTLAWAYWPSPDNALRPESASDESAAMAPRAFRTLLAGLLGVPDPLAPIRLNARRR